MALREILTHHGGSAGVFAPNMSSIISQRVESKDVNDIISSNQEEKVALKRERSIDLNMLIQPNDSEPQIKRPKLEDLSLPIAEVKIANFDGNVKEEDMCDLQAEVVHQQADDNLIEAESIRDIASINLSSIDDLSSAQSICLYDEKGSAGNSNSIGNLGQGSEMMMLVKLARHSWLRNCEFLQDSAVRFLCVLSLDRYDSTLTIKS